MVALRAGFPLPAGAPARDLVIFPALGADSMRSICLLTVLALLAASPAAAQETIRPGQRVTGELSAADPVLADGSHYDVWRFAALPGHRYVVTLRSAAFDAFLAVGRSVGPACDACATDDDGAGGTDAFVEYTGARGGTYEIRANSYDEHATGPYELLLEDAGTAEDPAPIAARPIVLNQRVEGELARGDGKDHGRSYSDTYTYRGRAGETIVITLSSPDFDARLDFGKVNLGACRALDRDDDGGEGTDARLTVTLPEDGEYHVHVGSSQAGQRGRYTLLVARGTQAGVVIDGVPAQVVSVPSPIEAGETVEGELKAGDARADDGSFYQAWLYRGRAGETLTIRMQPSDFDAYLAIGRTVQDAWTELEVNDDGPEGTNSELTVTLPRNGEYVIRANAFQAGQTGRYTLRVDRN
jgi:hypothetical protein